MDINDLRSIVTVAALLCFLAITAWAYSRNREADFAEAANLPFSDPEEAAQLAHEALGIALGCRRP